MFAGFFVTLEVADKVTNEQFVTPAILNETVAAMMNTLQDKDPQDEFVIRVHWGSSPDRPAYTIQQVRPYAHGPRD
jgi:hypothetical protein